MKHLRDPFPPTPEGFHNRVEATLLSLDTNVPLPKSLPPRGRWPSAARSEGVGINPSAVNRPKKTLLLVAAIIVALALVGAVAAMIGHSGFKQRLSAEGAIEVAGLVEEPHLSAAGNGFDFSIDELLWEGGDLYVSYSLSVPEDGAYLVAMSTPTLNGEKLIYDAKGWTTPKFIDADEPAVLLMGGDHRTRCSELWTFAVDARLKQQSDNRLAFRAALYRTELDLDGTSDWTDMLDPPDSLSAGVPAAIESAEYVAQREIHMDLDASKLSQTVYNDVIEHDFDVDGMHLHVDAFRMTHLGITIEYTLSTGDFPDENWGFCTPEGAPLGHSLGSTGSGALERLADGSAVCHCSCRDSLLLPLNGLGQIAFAPEGDVARGILLTPTFDPGVVDPTPRPAVEHGEDISK